MPTGRFETAHNRFFDAIDGAYTSMTAEEVRKGTYNVKAVIREMAADNRLAPAIDRSVRNCTFMISDKVSGFAVPAVELSFRYSKPLPDNEMTVYFNVRSGIPSGRLVSGNIWFIYFKTVDTAPRLGIMTPAEWAAISAPGTIPSASANAFVPAPSRLPHNAAAVRHRIIKMERSPEIELEKQKLDLELSAEIADFDFSSVFHFEYFGKPKEKTGPISSGLRKSYKRDKQTSANALAKAEHECEVDKSHPSFIRKRSDVRYMESHHLIPMEYQEQFKYSLDVEENIVSLCSNCHNRLHYGKDIEQILKKLYLERTGPLRTAGIEILFDELLEIYI